MKKNKGKRVQAVKTQFDPAERVEEIAKELIPKYHTHLVSSDIRYLYVNKELKRKGKVTIGYMEKVSSKVSAISNGAEFLMVISYPVFNELTEKQKYAVVDHELCHAFVDDDDTTGDKKLTILPHDVEEFIPVIKRHNLYLSDLEVLGRVMQNQTVDTEETYMDTDDITDYEDLLE